MKIEDVWYDLAIKSAERAKSCLSDSPLEAAKLLISANKYAKDSKRSLPREYQNLYTTTLESEARKNFNDARNEMQNSKPRETSRCLDLALKSANEIDLKLPLDDLKDIERYVIANGMRHNCEENFKKYVVKHGLEEEFNGN